MKILLTGAAGFIGSAFARLLLDRGHDIVVLDKLTYAGHLENLKGLEGSKFFFQHGSITDGTLVRELFHKHRFDAVVNMAAESHVDNSINSPHEFIDTNIVGTYNLLNSSLAYYKALDETKKKSFRFLQVSTDEVFGSLGDTGKFSETSPYSPNSPYSASKAAADHLVRAWFHTYQLPTLITNCSNNYGPRQFPEKMIPTMITHALAMKPLPVYGRGENVRDWIHVEDHCEGVYLALTRGTPGESYCFGGNAEKKNLDLVKKICAILDELKPRSDKKSYSELISFVTDRAGHDWRYAIDDSKAQRELGFRRKYDFDLGLKATLEWYLAHPEWIKAVSQRSTT